MTDLLHRIGYTYEMPKLVPRKTDTKSQEEFIEYYKKLKENKDANDYYLLYSWIKKRKIKELRCNAGTKDSISMDQLILKG